jgi:hypothetical protein
MCDLVPVVDKLKPADWSAHLPLVIILALIIIVVDAAILFPAGRRLRSGAAQPSKQMVPGIKTLFSFQRLPRAAVLGSLLLSVAAFTFSADVLRMPPYMVTLYTLFPWIPALFIETS